MIHDDFEVLSIEVLTRVLVRLIPFNALVPRTSCNGVCLARWSADQNPFGSVTQRCLDTIVNIVMFRDTEFCVPRFRCGSDCLFGETLEQCLSVRSTSENIVIQARNALGRKLPKKSPQEQGLMGARVLLDGEANLETRAAVTSLERCEPFAKSSRTGEEINHWHGVQLSQLIAIPGSRSSKPLVASSSTYSSPLLPQTAAATSRRRPPWGRSAAPCNPGPAGGSSSRRGRCCGTPRRPGSRGCGS